MILESFGGNLSGLMHCFRYELFLENEGITEDVNLSFETPKTFTLEWDCMKHKLESQSAVTECF